MFLSLELLLPLPFPLLVTKFSNNNFPNLSFQVFSLFFPHLRTLSLTLVKPTHYVKEQPLFDKKKLLEMCGNNRSYHKMKIKSHQILDFQLLHRKVFIPELITNKHGLKMDNVHYITSPIQ